MGEQPVSEGAPEGREDPGKIGPLKLWQWALVAGGVFVGVWYLKGRQSQTGPPTVVGATSGAVPGDATSGVSITDPMTASALLQAMQDLATRLGASSVSPTPATPDPSTGATAGAAATPAGYAQGISTSHVTGGSSTANAAVAGIPITGDPMSAIARSATVISSAAPLGGGPLGTPLAQAKTTAPVNTPALTPLGTALISPAKATVSALQSVWHAVVSFVAPAAPAAPAAPSVPTVPYMATVTGPTTGGAAASWQQ